MRLFQKISRFMVREMSLPEVLQGVVSLVVEFTQCDSCLVYLLANDELVLCASNTPHPSTIGKIRIEDQFTLVDVPEQFVDKILLQNGNYRIGKHKFALERA